MVRPVISGYYGFNNLGDEAVLYSMLKLLKEQDPALEPVVLSNDPGHTARTYGVKAVNRWKISRVAAALRNADILISGGGSLLQDVTGIKSIVYYTGVMRLARLLRRPVVFYAQGIGPIHSAAGRRLAAAEARRARKVTVRDAQSCRELLDMGVDREIIVTVDPVAGLDPDEVDPAPGLEILQRAGAGPGEVPRAGIAVRQWAEERWQQELAGACDRLAEKGLQVVFLPMQYPADVQAAAETAGLMRQKSTVLRRECSVPEMLSVVKNLDLLVGMRLHSLIFAAVLGVPPVGISYDPKVERFLARLGLEPAGAPESLAREVLWKGIENGLALDRQQLLAKVTPLREEARRGAEIILAGK